MVSKDEFDQEVQNIVKQLLHVYRPQKVVLFGSLVKSGIEGQAESRVRHPLFTFWL